MGRSGAVCEVWLDSVNSLISQKRTAVFLILLPFLIDLPLQNTVFLVKTDPRWPNSPQMRGGACFELGRSIAAGQQKHFSCFFGLLKNLKVWGCALTLSFPRAARLSQSLFAAGGKPGSAVPTCGKHRAGLLLPYVMPVCACTALSLPEQTRSCVVTKQKTG